MNLLGHIWNKESDLFGLKSRVLSLPQANVCKRDIMGLVMKVCWDPIGLLLPVSMQFRIELQSLWQMGLSWDEVLPSNVIKTWQLYVNVMNSLSNVQIKRCIKPENAIGYPQIHAFSDGGDKAFGTCVFLRWQTSNGYVLTFIFRKRL